MFIYLTHFLVIHIIVFQMVMLVVILSNVLILNRARHHIPPVDFPFVSILVPARNEEKNIEKCLRSLLAQDYPFFEIIVLDDQSTDNTPIILQQLAGFLPKLKVIPGSPSPAGQPGKNWACVQLVKMAQGGLLFFTDADTVHQPRSLRSIVTAMLGEQADLMTGFPRQEMQSWGERLLVPFFSWANLCFNPLWLAYRLRLPLLSNGVGQMMLFQRDAYHAIGGHAGVGASIVDDLTLARKIKAGGLSWRVVNITDLVTTRMYFSSRAAIDGFKKNYFAAFDFRILPYLFVFTWLMVMFWEPLILLVLFVLGLVPQIRIIELIISIGLACLLWWIPYYVLGLPARLVRLYPLTVLANSVVAFQSLVLSLTGRLTWKDRTLSRPRWKWL
jgi:chlorobactene glucosyltransferase